MTRRTPLPKDEVREMWEAGIPAWEIARKFKTTVVNINQMARRLRLSKREVPDVPELDTTRFRELWHSGMTVADIGRKIGLSSGRVSSIAKELGLPRRKRVKFEITRQTIVEGLAAGHSVRNLAARVGCDELTLRRAMDRFGIAPPRGKRVPDEAPVRRQEGVQDIPSTLTGRLIATKGRWSELEAIRKAQGWTPAQVQQRYHAARRTT